MVDRAIGQSLRALSQLASSPLMERLGLSGSVEKWLYQGTKASLKAAGKAAQRVRPVVKLLEPVRMAGEGASQPDGFDLTPTESQALITDSMARFAREVMRPAALHADEKGAPPDGFLAAAHALGLTQLAVPEALGGAGESRSVVTQVLVVEELARGDMGLALAALAPLGVVHALCDFGTAEQQGAYLPSFVADAPFPAALALLEPRPLFDPHHLVTRATTSGGEYVLEGQKSLVPLAEAAELFLVVADLNGRPAAFLVEKGAAGLAVEREPAMGLNAAALGRLKLSGVRVPGSARLGGDAGFDAERLIDLARLGWCALGLGTGAAMLDYVKTYCRDRVAFGEPIVRRQSVAFMIADMALELDAMRLMVYRAAARAERARPFRRETSLARLQCADKAMQIGTNGVQLLGGHGFIKEHPVELWYRQLRGVGIYEGAVSV
jgi:alkylation response protein AidB-like acyl-CoA dehydrogenase